MAGEQNDLVSQRKFLSALRPELLEYRDDVIWLVKNILAKLPEASRELLKLKYRLSGGYAYTDKELASIFKKPSIAELQRAVRCAMIKARAIAIQLQGKLK